MLDSAKGEKHKNTDKRMKNKKLGILISLIIMGMTLKKPDAGEFYVCGYSHLVCHNSCGTDCVNCKAEKTNVCTKSGDATGISVRI